MIQSIDELAVEIGKSHYECMRWSFREHPGIHDSTWEELDDKTRQNHTRVGMVLAAGMMCGNLRFADDYTEHLKQKQR